MEAEQLMIPTVGQVKGMDGFAQRTRVIGRAINPFEVKKYFLR